MRRRWIQDRETGKLIEVTPGAPTTRQPATAAVIPDIDPFLSPVDGTVVSSRRDLRAHNARHGVAEHREYGENHGQNYFERTNQARLDRLHGRDAATRAERHRQIVEIVRRHES